MVLHADRRPGREHSDLLVRLESANTGKPIDGVAATTSPAPSTRSGSWPARPARPPLRPPANYAEDHLSVIMREPLGVVGVVTPWNYPLLMAAWKIAPILAAGNTLVIKPSEQTPLTTLKFAELVADLLPAGVLNVVTGTGPVVGARLSEHPDIDMIALTGSVNSGRAVARGAAESLKRVHLELGGKAPVVDLRRRRPGRRGHLAAGRRVLELRSGMRRRLPRAGPRVGGRRSSWTTWSTRSPPWWWASPAPATTSRSARWCPRRTSTGSCGYLERAARPGIRAAVGGSALDGPGYFVAPTVLVDVPDGAECAREEIFGPVITVETFADEDEAVARANAVPYGLAASVWTENARRSHDVAARLDSGTVWVNSHLVLANEAPWGGFKGSGYGRDLSIYALDDYSRTKHVMHNHGR